MYSNADDDRLPRNPHSACIFNFSPEYPDIPFLSIKDDERKQRVFQVDEVFGGGRLAALIKFQPIPLQSIRHWGSDDFERRRRNVRRKTVAFDMNWTLSEPELVEVFRAWMRKERKRDQTAPQENRGAGGSERQYRTWLKELGALRLLRQMDWQAARDLSVDASKEEKPIYLNQANWIGANENAEARLVEFSKDFF